MDSTLRAVDDDSVTVYRVFESLDGLRHRAAIPRLALGLDQVLPVRRCESEPSVLPMA
jgi:hypothetical protein